MESTFPGTLTYPANKTNIVLGAKPTGTEGKGNFMNGTIYSARIYSRALTDEEMSVNLLNDRERYNL